jgi:hypothetical protein
LEGLRFSFQLLRLILGDEALFDEKVQQQIVGLGVRDSGEKTEGKGANGPAEWKPSEKTASLSCRRCCERSCRVKHGGNAED